MLLWPCVLFIVTRSDVPCTTHSQTCQVSRNFRESPEIVHDLQVSPNSEIYQISRNLGNLIDVLLIYSSAEVACFWSES